MLKWERAKSIIYSWKLEVTFLLELLSNQWNRSTRKSSKSKHYTSENRSAALFAVLLIMWQAQPFINIFLFFANPRVIMEFFFPTFTAVLSSPATTQFSQSTLFSLRMELMLLKSASAVPSLHAPISKSWTETFPLLSLNKQIKTWFNFFRPDSSSDPSVPSESGQLFICRMSSDLKII